MSWGTSYKQEVELYRHRYSSLADLEDKIQETKKDIGNAKAELMALASCTPKDIVVNNEDVDNALDTVLCKFYEIWEVLEEDMLTLYRLEGLKENWETKEEW